MIKKILICLICVLSLLALAACNEPEESTPTPTVSSVELDRTVLVMDKGDKIGVSAKIYPTEVTASLIWHSTNTAVVTVTDGVLKAVAPGNALVICTTPDGKYGKCNVVVNDNECVHVEGQWIIDKEPTCSVNGVKHTECTLCKQVMKVETTENTNHSYEWRSFVDATCTSRGIKYKECTKCGDRIDISTTNPTGKHKESDWIVDAEAACGQNGVKHTECTVCKMYIQIELTPMNSNHVKSTPVIENEENQTCLKGGSYDSVTYCKICNLEIDRTTILTMPGEHIYTDWFNVSATCYDNGTEKRECKICGKDEERERDALGHDLVSHEGLEPTCYSEGYTDYETCTRCDYTTYQTLEVTHHSYVLEYIMEPSKDISGSAILYCKYDCDFNNSPIPDIIEIPAFTDPAWERVSSEIAPEITEFIYTATDRFGVSFNIYFLLDEDYNILA